MTGRCACDKGPCKLQDTIPSFFKYSPDADPMMLCATPHVAVNYMHAPDYVLQRRCPPFYYSVVSL